MRPRMIYLEKHINKGGLEDFKKNYLCLLLNHMMIHIITDIMRMCCFFRKNPNDDSQKNSNWENPTLHVWVLDPFSHVGLSRALSEQRSFIFMFWRIVSEIAVMEDEKDVEKTSVEEMAQKSVSMVGESFDSLKREKILWKNKLVSYL